MITIVIKSGNWAILLVLLILLHQISWNSEYHSEFVILYTGNKTWYHITPIATYVLYHELHELAITYMLLVFDHCNFVTDKLFKLSDKLSLIFASIDIASYWIHLSSSYLFLCYMCNMDKGICLICRRKLRCVQHQRASVDIWGKSWLHTLHSQYSKNLLNQPFTV